MSKKDDEQALYDRVRKVVGERILDILVNGRDGDLCTAADINTALKWLDGAGSKNIQSAMTQNSIAEQIAAIQESRNQGHDTIAPVDTESTDSAIRY